MLSSFTPASPISPPTTTPPPLSNDPWFRGPWFVRVHEVQHQPTRMFYNTEVFMSNIRDTNPMRSIMRKCAILHTSDYIRSECDVFFFREHTVLCFPFISLSFSFTSALYPVRPTDIPEVDVFLCESQYNEAEKSINRMKSLKVV